MGFFSGILGGSQKATTPASGYYALPKDLQNIYSQLTPQLKNTILPNGQLDVSAFTPQGLSGSEQEAIGNVNQGFTPTNESIQSDLSMLMGNPYNESVINEINRQAQGQNSLVNQAATQAGQQGSNRSFLGSSDVEQNRLNNIGQFQQQQYNTALNQILNNIAPSRRQDASGQLAVGDMLRNLDLQTKQAPYNALNSAYGLIGSANGQMQGTPSQTIKTGGGLSGLLGGIGGLGGAVSGLGGLGSALGMGGSATNMLGSLGSAFSMFSDERLKENIEHVGIENGHNIYSFNYKGSNNRWVGVIAQEVEKIRPDAVGELVGYKTVDYNKIGVKMRAV